jgi:6-phosphogluconolactonase
MALLRIGNSEFMTKSNQSQFFTGGYAAANEPGIQSFLFDETSRKITLLGSFIGVESPTYLVVHPNRRWFYVASETGKDSHGALGEVWAFRFEREPFSIQPINHQSTRGDWPCHLRFDSTGKWLLATNYGTGNAAIFPLKSDGSIGEMTDFVQHHGKGPNAARQDGPHAHSSIFTPDDRFAIIADLGIDQLVIYKFDSASGKLLTHSSIAAQPGAGPRHLAFHQNGIWMYVANELNSTVTLYDYDGVTGRLTERESLSSIPADSPENTIADIHISPSGERVYVSNRGHNSIAVYDISGKGSLELVSIEDCGGNWPRNFTLAPSGNFMLVANQYSNEVCVLPIREGKNPLGAQVEAVPVKGASCVKFV